MYRATIYHSNLSDQSALEISVRIRVRLRVALRDCNPGLEFSIPGFGIVEFPIPGSRDPVGIGVVQLRLLILPRGLRYLGRYFLGLQVCTIVLWI